ncbi:terminase large subunit [Actinokineospora spheciospongiae]|uniref:terminase large subunit n=1 Tax=Actinokineospora spheciospongiae TaxID=909613 RepID=UPI000D99D7E2|nr:terminase large subunit [Actinokineospora spheciospongiae]PWW50259.1 phage terminase [Actinokineospora spheciospongiae]
MRFAVQVLGVPLDPWQRWLVIHGGELLPDGRPRFRKILVLVARQNGKTHVLVVLSLFWMFVERRPLILGTSTNLDYAKESWQKAVDLVELTPDLWEKCDPRKYKRETNGEQTLTIRPRPRESVRYKIAASNRRGGRSLTVHRLILDELREHASWSAWNAAYNAMTAVEDAQAWAITNQGDDSAVVLDSLRGSALTFIETGEGDEDLGLFEWSSPEGSDPTDVVALAMANPNLNRRFREGPMLSDARRVKAKGGEELAGFLTESMCRKVPNLDPAIDTVAWRASSRPGPMPPGARVALVFDVSIDSQHAVLVAGAMVPDEEGEEPDRVRVEVVEQWSGRGCLLAARKALPGLVARVRPAVFGWFPDGPAAVMLAALSQRQRDRGPAWPPKGVEVDEIRKDVAAVCMGLADVVDSGQLLHSDDPLLNVQVEGAEKLHQGDKWRFTRRGVGHVNGTYGVAGVVHLARTLPPPEKPVGRPRLIVSGKSSASREP